MLDLVCVSKPGFYLFFFPRRQELSVDLTLPVARLKNGRDAIFEHRMGLTNPIREGLKQDTWPLGMDLCVKGFSLSPAEPAGPGLWVFSPPKL